MIYDFQIRMLPKQAAAEQSIKEFVVKEKGLDASSIKHVRVLRRSIDARHRQVFINLLVKVYVNEDPQDDMYCHMQYSDVSESPQVVVVGAGPGGLFAALRLIELGYHPVILERGKDVHERKKDLARISRAQEVDGDSNYCFGEGGAGAYSDGKLYTRSRKRGSVEKILNVFCQHGAPLSILCDAHPHIGTDRLPRVIETMRQTILNSGGEVFFQTKMTRFLMEKEKVVGVEAVDLRTGREKVFYGPVILATGHSARDVYRYLASTGIDMAMKGIAIGVRLEHPAALIDRIQYHRSSGRGSYLPAAEYSFVTQVAGRGVYSFCMCPGGVVIPAATDHSQVVVNGMSPSHRDTDWSNSGMVVEIRPDDAMACWGEGNNTRLKEDDPLLMMHLQEQLEYLCWQQGNRKQTAPAQRMTDFVDGHLSADLPSCSYAPGVVSSPVHFWLPPFIGMRLRDGFRRFGQMSRGFLTREATVIALETRTSAPVQILRDKDTLQHVHIEGLFPCGEGAGYAGGIVSAGIDGERCAEMCAEYIKAQIR